MQKQSSRKNRYTGEDIAERNDLGEMVPVPCTETTLLSYIFVLINVLCQGQDEGEHSVQNPSQNQQHDINRHFSGSSNMSKVKRKKTKMQTRTFIDSDGYMQVCCCCSGHDFICNSLGCYTSSYTHIHSLPVMVCFSTWKK